MHVTISFRVWRTFLFVISENQLPKHKMATSNPRETPLNETRSNETVDLPEGLTDPSATNGSSSSSPDTALPQCTQCKKPEVDLEKPFKPCSKCQTEKYCSRDCQKLAWKLHKKVCGEKAQAYAASANLKMDAPRVVKKEGFRGGKLIFSPSFGSLHFAQE